jgi:hypothetical protein
LCHIFASCEQRPQSDQMNQTAKVITLFELRAARKYPSARPKPMS